MSADLIYLVLGLALLLAVVLPIALSRCAVSAPIVLVGVGAVIGLLPFDKYGLDPVSQQAFTEHLAELTVIVALMGVGLALDRPLSLLRPRSWRGWSLTWRLLLIAMPLSIAGVALLGWWVMGLAPAAALLLGAALAPTDPVLASDVQVEGPSVTDDHDEIEESDQVRFALTSEAGLNDGLAFPFVYAAILLATAGPVAEWGLKWVGWYVIAKIAIGVIIGVVGGWLLGKIAFRSARESLAVARRGEPLLALGALLAVYGLAEVAQGYGFLAVFAAAMTLRSQERGHEYHETMHSMIERLEQILTLMVLLLLGIALTNGLLAALTWPGVLVGLALVFVVRPLAGWVALRVGHRSEPIGVAERWAIALFGVRGVGSVYYLAYAEGQAVFPELRELWSTMAFTIIVSVLVHGIFATPVMRRLERIRAAAA
ncbi:NhaP-type Na+/H+ or K+/H+ antiporter [Naumannella cuiyingiana]|uniref:NhaP-type Na+/H+ or K+/H+ antiporter n=1 Tax=Naumannella cuiyingiana TaxID=1347891 RepID=A0A7Z0D8Z2_9ACTN|nr:cation:proton antiporter [Naumannella cuiyingiana]NYI71140.1 NhaP-type Na+/H+ or K+/H+ antiporter [Naumannella cuiyingiana]